MLFALLILCIRLVAIVFMPYFWFGVWYPKNIPIFQSLVIKRHRMQQKYLAKMIQVKELFEAAKNTNWKYPSCKFTKYQIDVTNYDV